LETRDERAGLGDSREDGRRVTSGMGVGLESLAGQVVVREGCRWS
jgi:hypothetical protein